MSTPLDAIDAISIGLAPTADEVWNSLPAHAEGLHPEVSRKLSRSIAALGVGAAPIAAVVLGERGAGKTHLLTWTRQRIQERGGFFFYIKLVTGYDFWTSAVTSIVDGLYRADEDGQSQASRLIAALSRRAQLDDRLRTAFSGERELTPADVNAFVRGVRLVDRQVGMTASDTIRAVALIASSSAADDLGHSFLALGDADEAQCTPWGISAPERSAHRRLRDLARVIALGGPLVFAFDQLDNLVSVSERSLASPSTRESPEARRRGADIATGLMELREEARNTLMVVACQPDTWEKISRVAIRSSLDRFDVLPPLGAIPDEATAAAIVSGRFRSSFEAADFTPPYPTWPISPAALAEAPHRYTARRLLARVDKHITVCQRTRVPTELTSLSEQDVSPTAVETRDGPSPAELAALTELFRKLRDEADDLSSLDHSTEDQQMPRLLSAALRSLVQELDADAARFRVETDIGTQAALHVRLIYTVDEAREEEIHWSFRAIASQHATAVQNRMRRAMVEAGLEVGSPSRRLILLRNTPYPRGPKSTKIKADFFGRGGWSFPVSAADLRTFAALTRMLQERPIGLEAWLRRERPAGRTEFLEAVVHDFNLYLRAAGPAGAPSGGEHTPANSMASPEAESSADTMATSARAVTPVEAAGSDITIGLTVRGDRPFTVALEQLRKHTLVIGAAGSGKTMLIKRMIEESALRGISTIVLDPNDDLGRLGDPRPDATTSLTDEEASRAARYFTETEVVVWTPGLGRGRPLVFPPIPDFRPMLADDDDFNRLLTSTAAALESQAGIQGKSSRAIQQRGLLKRALERFAREGGCTVTEFIDMLAEPPSDLVNGRTTNLAVQMADTLKAAFDMDPLAGTSGEDADPGVLLTPSPGRSARISVISFIGLSGDGPSHFVRRLQASLFSWFRAHPTRGRPLGGLLVMDEAQNFVPSGKSNPSTESTVELIRQIRKYGLGMILASQVPKGVHNEVVNNTANQLVGRLTAPVQIAAAEKMAAARNSTLDNVGGLERGTFFASGEGTPYRKIRVPACLTYHSGPLEKDEIVERARRPM